MMLDAFLPEGITELAVDSIFMMPQLGVLADAPPEDPLDEQRRKAATDVFILDCLIRLGTAVAPIGPGKEGAAVPEGDDPPSRREDGGGRGSLRRHAAHPARRGGDGGGDAGAGLRVRPRRGQGEEPSRRPSPAGMVGIILDCRGRQPFALPEDAGRTRIQKLKEWALALDAYPTESSARWQRRSGRRDRAEEEQAWRMPTRPDFG